MNKIIPFNKDITFDEEIGEIISIALDDTLKFVDKNTIKGELIIRGCKKLGDIEEDFSYPIPVEIAVDDKYNTEKASINIDDFYYEIINGNILHVKIDLILDDLYYKEEKKIETRNITIDLKDDLIKEEDKIKKDNDNNEEVDILDLFKEKNTNEEKEYSIYRVYVVDENDTLDSILNKYKVSKDDLEEFNDLSDLKPGLKLIIPSIDE